MEPIQPNEVCWVIESLMFGEEYDTGMKSVLEARGNPYLVISPIDTSIRIPREFRHKCCVLYHGSIQTLAKYHETENILTPGEFASFDNFIYSELLLHWGKNDVELSTGFRADRDSKLSARLLLPTCWEL